MIKLPEGLVEAEDGISNFDGLIPGKIAGLLKLGTHFTTHAAWDHHGLVWFADGKFHEQVMVYGSHRETVSSELLEDLIYEVNAKYGEG